MFEITLITVGKLKEKFYLSAAAEYEKRLKGYCSFKILELPESKLPDNPPPLRSLPGWTRKLNRYLQNSPKAHGFAYLLRKASYYLPKHCQRK